MPRKREAETVLGPDWFLVDWLRYYGKSQADIVRDTDWSKATVSEIVNGKTGYYRKIVNELARVLNVQPFELLMHPDDAFALRRLRENALTIAADTHATFTPAPTDEAERLTPRRKMG